MYRSLIKSENGWKNLNMTFHGRVGSSVKKPNYFKYKNFFLWVNIMIINKTNKQTCHLVTSEK